MLLLLSLYEPTKYVFSRAGVAIPNGYTMQCIMQLLNADGDKIGDQVTKPVTDGKVSFTISVDEQKEVSKHCFGLNTYQKVVLLIRYITLLI